MVPPTSRLQLPLWEPESDWKPPKVSELPSWEGVKRVGFDVETYDPELKTLGPGPRRGGYVVGYGFAFEDGPSFYVPVRHGGGDNVENPDNAIAYLHDQAKHYKGIVVGANTSYDLDFAANDDIIFRSVKFIRDVQIADPLIYELHQSYSLQAICERFGIPGKDETLLIEAARQYGVDPKGGLWQLPARFAGQYGAHDAHLPLTVLRRQERLIDEQDLWEVFDLESRVQPVLVKMRRRGVRVDQDRLAKIENWSLEQEAEALAKIKSVTGVTIKVGDVWKAGPIAAALEVLGVKVPYKMSKAKVPKRQYSITQEFLEGIDHEVAQSILWARKTNKLRTTFAASVRKHMINGRIHCTFNQLRKTTEEGESKGAAYGRLSSQDPNMQQQPIRDEFGKEWRSIYIPEDDCLWYANDYSQQEPRMLVHFAELVGLPKAAEAAQRYRDDPNTDNHQMMAEMAQIERFPAKQLFLGKCYGMGGFKLCKRLDLPTRWAVFYRNGPPRYFDFQVDAVQHATKTGGRAWPVAGEEGQAIIDKFDDRLPFVKMMLKKCEQLAAKRGYIKTLSGRRCRFPQDMEGRYDWTHKALNRLIQGSSADQTKKALVDGDDAGYYIQLQVHDEIDGSAQNKEEAEGLAEVMSNCYQLQVPFLVDVEVGPSWGEAK